MFTAQCSARLFSCVPEAAADQIQYFCCCGRSLQEHRADKIDKIILVNIIVCRFTPLVLITMPVMAGGLASVANWSQED